MAKDSKPIKTNNQLVKLLSKRARLSTIAAEEFRSAGREDLTEKEHAQITIMQGYMSEVGTLSADEIVAEIEAAVKQLHGEGTTPKQDNVRALLFRPDGLFEDKVIDQELVTQTIRRLVHQVAPST